MIDRPVYVLKSLAVAFLAIVFLLVAEWIGGFFWEQNKGTEILSRNQITRMKELPEEKTCLLIIDSENSMSQAIYPYYYQVLTDMRVGFETLDLYNSSFTRFEIIKLLENYKTIVIATDHYYPLREAIVPLSDWVKNGGRLLIGMTPLRTDDFDNLIPMLGITKCGDGFKSVQDFISDESFMIGAQETYTFTDYYDSALDVELDPKATVYAHTSSGVPLIWTVKFGVGRFVVCNFCYLDKAYRGIYASAYTLLDDVFVYPVINASTFYLDDFPSPTPSGDGEYVKRDYGLGIAQFYKQVWWPKVLELGDKHGIKYTGLIIETYENNTGEELSRNKSTLDISYYGKALRNNDGELGYHGYNHQPLCGPDYAYEEDFGYKVWDSHKAMFNSLDELMYFSENLFPATTMEVYVPPSDILSSEGREMIGKEFPDIRAIASIYGEGPDAYSQEFEVASDGVVETPRIVSSCNITDFMQLAAFCELNFHYVQSHFMHPDDLLDPDRGAAIGWETLSKQLDDYMTWVDTSAPDIRHLTGSGMAGAVQRFVNVTPTVTVTPDQVEIRTEGLIDSAYYMIRATDDELINVKGGKLTRLNETLYLLEVQNEIVTITRK